MFLSLPIEVIDKICRATPRADCSRLASVSWPIHTIANRILYWNVELDEHNLLPFIRTVFLHEGPTLPADPFLMVRQFRVSNRDLLFICKGNPLLSIALSRMSNLHSLDLCIGGFAGDVSYLFLSKTGLILRERPSAIPILRPLEDCDWVKTDGLPNLRRLTVAGNPMFLRLATRRTVNEIVISSMMRLSLQRLTKITRHICGEDIDHKSLRRLTFSLVTHGSQDILTAISNCMHAFPNLEGLEITVYNKCKPIDATPLQGMFSDKESDIDPGWTSHINARQLRSFALLGDVRYIIPIYGGQSLSEKIGKYFSRSMPRLNTLKLGNYCWALDNCNWTFTKVFDEPDEGQYYPLWRNDDPCRLRANLEEEPQIGDMNVLCLQWDAVHRRWLEHNAIHRP